MTMKASYYITRPTILKEIRNNLDMVKQWRAVPDNADWASNVFKYACQAEALIELLEVADCGSVGGFAPGQPPTNRLEERYKWLLEVEVPDAD